MNSTILLLFTLSVIPQIENFFLSTLSLICAIAFKVSPVSRAKTKELSAVNPLGYGISNHISKSVIYFPLTEILIRLSSLDNLVKVTAPKNYPSGVWNDIPFPADVQSTTAIPIVCEYQDEFYFVIFDNNKTKFKTFSKTGDKGSVSVSFVFLRVN